MLKSSKRFIANCKAVSYIILRDLASVLKHFGRLFNINPIKIVSSRSFIESLAGRTNKDTIDIWTHIKENPNSNRKSLCPHSGGKGEEEKERQDKQADEGSLRVFQLRESRAQVKPGR